MAYEQKKPQRPPSRYVNSSSFVKNLLFDGENGAPGEKQQVHLEPGITEEISISLTAEKVKDFFEKLDAAVADPQGDGGLRITLYCSHKVNKESGEEFDGASITVVGKFPSKNNFKKGGSFSGNSNRGGGNGRRDYPQGGGQQTRRGEEHPGGRYSPGGDYSEGKPTTSTQERSGTSSTTPQTGRGTTSKDNFEEKNMGKSNGTTQVEKTAPTSKYSQEPGW